VAVSAGYALRASPTVIHITSLAGRLNAGVARILTGYAGRMPTHPGNARPAGGSRTAPAWHSNKKKSENIFAQF